MPGTAALTGATGFIGRHLAARLVAYGWRLRIFSRSPQAADEVPCDTAVTGNFEEKEKLAELVSGADVVIHAAGAIKARGSADFRKANAETTARLIDACAATATKPRFLLVSTLAAREPQISGYAASKAAGEEAAKARRDALESLTILRPPAVYGPGDRETLAFFKMLQRGFAVIPKAPEARLSLIHVRDLVDCIATAAASQALPQGTFETADPAPQGYSWQEMVAAGEAAVGRQVRRLSLPRPLADTLGSAISAFAALGGGTPMLSRDKAAELFHPDWVVHDRRLQEALDCPPSVRLAEGFSETVAWYREQAWLEK